jgi:hypothetical protein
MQYACEFIQRAEWRIGSQVVTDPKAVGNLAEISSIIEPCHDNAQFAAHRHLGDGEVCRQLKFDSTAADRDDRLFLSNVPGRGGVATSSSCEGLAATVTARQHAAKKSIYIDSVSL